MKKFEETITTADVSTTPQRSKETIQKRTSASPEEKKETIFNRIKENNYLDDNDVTKDDIIDLLIGLQEALETTEEHDDPATAEGLLYIALDVIKDLVDISYIQEDSELFDNLYEFLTYAWGFFDDELPDSYSASMTQEEFDEWLDSVIANRDDAISEIYRTVIRGGKRVRKKFLNPSEKRRFMTAKRRAAFRKLARMRRSRRKKLRSATKMRIKRSLRLARRIYRK